MKPNKPYFVKYVTVNGETKLYVCTKNIKLYDEVYNPITHEFETLIKDASTLGRFANGNTDPFEVEQCGSFKVIGEVSPEAIWLNENDELQHEDLLAQGHGVNWSVENPDCGGFKFKVKCPSCKNFH